MFYLKPLRLLLYLGITLVVLAVVLHQAEGFRPKYKPDRTSHGKFIDHHYGKFGKHTMQTRRDKHILSKRKKPTGRSQKPSPLVLKPSSPGKKTNLKPVSLNSPVSKKSMNLKPVNNIKVDLYMGKQPKTNKQKQQAEDRQKDVGRKVYSCPKEAIEMNCLSCKTKVYRKCPVVGASKITGIHVQDEYPSSLGRCYVGRKQNFGILDDGSTDIWVDKGCRAKFIICYDRAIKEPKTVSCSCMPGASIKRCTIPDMKGSNIVIKVDMLFKFQGQCKEQKTWGYDDRNIWVNNGCGATFKVFWS